MNSFILGCMSILVFSFISEMLSCVEHGCAEEKLLLFMAVSEMSAGSQEGRWHESTQQANTTVDF